MPPAPLIARAERDLIQLKEALLQTGPDAGLHVFLYAQRGRHKADKWRRLRFENGLASRFRARICDNLFNRVLLGRELVAFSFDDMISNHVGVIEKRELGEVASWCDSVPSPDWQHIFDGALDFSSKVKFHVTTITVVSPQNTLRVFKKRAITSLVRSGGLRAIFNSLSNQFSEIEGDVFDFSLDCDFFEWNDLIFIFNLISFESLTGIRQITITKATDALAAISAIDNLVIDGLEGVSLKLQSKPQLAKKLAAAMQQGTIAAVSADALFERIVAKKLPLQTGLEGNVRKITVNADDSEQVAEFVNVLTDVYLWSPVTEMEYKVHSKTPAS